MPAAELCPHFGECGGCHTQDLAYPEQLARKSDALETLLQGYWAAPISVLPSPAIWHYRNKVELNFGAQRFEEKPPPGTPRDTMLGFKRRGRWYWTLDLTECRIGPPGLDALMAAVRTWYREAALPPYDNRRRTGLLRHLVVRHGRRTGERMVVLVTAPGEVDTAGFARAVHGAWPDVTSLYWGIHSSPSDHAVAETLHRLTGAEHIRERLEVPRGEGTRDLDFRISPYSFFQTNTVATEVLYSEVRQWVEAVRPGVLYDLYGGMGGIALTCADLVEHVISVESWEPASRDGEHNARANGVDNVRFETAEVERFLAALAQADGLPEGCGVILDPPRSGLHPKALRRLLELRPARLLYVSCNPKILAQELALFGEAYRLADVRAIDLFPHTPHVEVLARLEINR